MSITKCKICNPEIDFSTVLRSFLPSKYDYTVCCFSGDLSGFKTRLRTSGKDQEYALKWLDDFHMHSKCTMRVDRTYPHSGTKNVYKLDLRCQHNTRRRNDKAREKEFCKNTDCPAKMCITVKRVVTERKSRSKDPHLPEYPTVIQMDFHHNHAILSPEILKHRSVLPEVKEKLLALFRLGHNPGTALDMHRYDLLLQHGEDFAKVCHDRALLPDPKYCYRLFYKIVRKNSDSMNGENTDTDTNMETLPNSPDKKDPLTSCENSAALNFDSAGEKQPNRAKKKRRLEATAAIDKQLLEELLCKFCEGGGFAGMQIVEDNTVMALCSPLMHRVHKLIKQSGNMVFVDSYGEMEDSNCCRVFLLTTYSCIGPVPLACLASTSESGVSIRAAFDLFKQILPNGCFFDKEGPHFFFTNDNEVERQSLKSIFPQSQFLICLSHLLQSSWTFVLDRKNGIKRDQRTNLFSKIRLLLFSQTSEELEMNYTFVMGDDLVKTYPLFVDYLTYIYNRRHEWSHVYKRHSIPSDSNMSFFWESAMILLKDPILSRSRTYNPLQVIDFMSRLDTYYEKKLIDLANNRFDSVRLSRFLFIELPREAYTITQISESEYEIHNDTKDTTYQTDITLGMCECRTGKSGAPCKHQLLVYRNFSVPVYDCVPPATQAEKNVIIHLATGQEVGNSPHAIDKTDQAAVHVHQVIQDVYPGDFLLEDGCEALIAAGISHPGVLTPHNPSLNLPSNQIVQAPHVLEHQPLNVPTPIHSIVNSQHQDSPVNHQLSDHSQELNQHLTNPIPPPQPPPPSCPDPVGTDPNSISDLVDQICSRLKDKTAGSPQVFRPALGTFLKNLEDLSAESSLEYALYSFGKFTKSSTVMFKRRVVDNKLVGIQSTGELKKLKAPNCTKPP